MNLRFIKFSFFILVFGALSLSLRAQVENEATLKQTMLGIFDKTAQTPHRILETYESGFKEKEATTIHKTIIEVEPPDKMYISTKVLKETCGFNYGEFTKDTLYIGEKEYERKFGGDWKEIFPEKNKPQSEIKRSTKDWNYSFLRTEKIDGQILNIYEMTWDWAETAYKNTIKRVIWVNAKTNLPVRMLEEWNYTSSQFTFDSKITSLYEYDANIKIEAPKLN